MSSLPFSAVVGQDEAKLALLLAAVEPRLGGVLLRGEKGSAKSTLARGLSALLPGDAPFVELPLGASEDRVLGSIDLAALLADGTHRFRSGLLAAADGGVLYVDEVNLLPDHLVDSLLDVAASGVNTVERDGVSHRHEARFVLVGSMNPEEGELRPQLLDRFGLAVDVAAPLEVPARVEAVRRQLGSERTNQAAEPAWTELDLVLGRRLEGTSAASIADALITVASRLAVAVGAEGLRADLMLCRAATALAAWEGRTEATEDDLRRVAPLVLAHRRRRSPFEQPGIDPDELEDAFDHARCERDDGPDDGQAQHDGDGSTDPEVGGGDLRFGAMPDAVGSAPPVLGATRPVDHPDGGGRSPARGRTGRSIRSTSWEGAHQAIAVLPTALAVAEHRAERPGDRIRPEDLRSEIREHTSGNLVVLAVDTSGSMGAEQRLAAARGAVLGLLADAYRRRDRVALVAVGGANATLVLRPTGSVEVATNRLADLPVGGGTPLADGLRTIARIVEPALAGSELQPIIVLITDGRATVGEIDPLGEARAAARDLARRRVPTVVVDAESGMPRLGLAATLADDLGADVVDLESFGDGELVQLIRAQGDGGRP